MNVTRSIVKFLKQKGINSELYFSAVESVFREVHPNVDTTHVKIRKLDKRIEGTYNGIYSNDNYTGVTVYVSMHLATSLLTFTKIILHELRHYAQDEDKVTFSDDYEFGALNRMSHYKYNNLPSERDAQSIEKFAKHVHALYRTKVALHDDMQKSNIKKYKQK